MVNQDTCNSYHLQVGYIGNGYFPKVISHTYIHKYTMTHNIVRIYSVDAYIHRYIQNVTYYPCIHMHTHTYSTDVPYLCMYTYISTGITSMLVNSQYLRINNFQVVENISEGGSVSWVLTPTLFSEIYIAFRFIAIWQLRTIRDFP